MMRLKRLEVVGFRAFGAVRQVLELEKDLAIVYAPNSHGKTSLAEAVEFLLTGGTSRRELVGSAVREFADALRNAHLAPGQDVEIRATIQGADGSSHIVERKLVADYSAKGNCTSSLTIDGRAAESVAELGIALSQPPLAAPVLMPHGLRYVIQLEPTQRTTYFKMLLEMADLDEVRRQIAGLSTVLTAATEAVLAKLDACKSNPVFGAALSRCGTSLSSVRAALAEALRLAAGSPADFPEDLDATVGYLRALMAEKQAAAFPIDSIRPGPAPSWTTPPPSALDDVLAYHRLIATIDADVSRIERLYSSLLEIPAYKDLKPPAVTKCPVCKTEDALTGARIEEIRTTLKSSAGVAAAREKANRALREVRGHAEGALRAITAARPTVFAWDAAERARRGFSVEALAAMLGEAAQDKARAWRDSANALRSATTEAEAALKPLEASLAALRIDGFDDVALASARSAFVAIERAVASVGAAHAAYVRAHAAVVEGVEPALARKTSTEGWSSLLALAAVPEDLLKALREEQAQKATTKELERALKDIDAAIAGVLDAKYDQLGGDVSKWWQLMRPDTTTRFSGLQRAGSGRRYIDMKAGLFESDARTKPTAIRDAVAVFSDSQLNALGLAAFLARSARQRCGFVVLDDPFPGSDGDHRTMFIDKVLPALADEGIQVVLLTHDDRAVVDTQAMYADFGIDSFEIGLSDPVRGAVVTRTKDDLDVLLSKASGLLGTSPAATEPRKLAAQHLRDAAERFCKLVIVRDRTARGTTTFLSDLGQTLGQLVPMTEPLLTLDRGDPGKLRVMPARLNPGNHDDKVPSTDELKQTWGNLRTFKKRYLDHAKPAISPACLAEVT